MLDGDPRPKPVPQGFASTREQGRRPDRQQKQRVSEPLLRKRKTQRESPRSRCRRCRSFCVLASFSALGRKPLLPQAHSRNPQHWRRPGQLRLARRGCSDAGRETAGLDRSTRVLAVPPALAVHPARQASRHQACYRRFFSRYLICLTWAESNPRAVPTSRLDRPAINISRAASVLVLV